MGGDRASERGIWCLFSRSLLLPAPGPQKSRHPSFHFFCSASTGRLYTYTYVPTTTCLEGGEGNPWTSASVIIPRAINFFYYDGGYELTIEGLRVPSDLIRGLFFKGISIVYYKLKIHQKMRACILQLGRRPFDLFKSSFLFLILLSRLVTSGARVSHFARRYPCCCCCCCHWLVLLTGSILVTTFERESSNPISIREEYTT